MAVVQMRASPIVLYHNSTHHWPLYKQTSTAPQGPSFEENSQKLPTRFSLSRRVSETSLSGEIG